MIKNKQFTLLIFYFILGLLFAKSTYAQNSSWQKHPSNPVMTKGIQGEWDSIGRLLPFVMIDSGVYKMWFTGWDNVKNSIGYATSANGINWNLHNPNPVLTPNPSNSEVHLSDPTVIKDGSTYKMWMTAQLSNGKYVIKYSTSPDGIIWTTPQAISTTQQWQSVPDMVQPSVIKKAGQYLMWFSSVQNGIWKIGFATSTDGVNWTKNVSPVIAPTEPWETNNTGGGKVIERDNLFEIYYHAGSPHKIGSATSSDGISWTKNDNNPIIQAEGGGFDSQRVLSPSVSLSFDNKYLYMWYTGYNGTNYEIGLATLDLAQQQTEPPPVVIIPGLGASWNKEAMLHNQQVNQSDWTMTPSVEDYDYLVNTLKNAGYIDDKTDPKQNLFLFNYDWREQVDSISTVLNQYLTDNVYSKNPNKKILIVGHCLGALVGRAYIQNYQNHNVEQLITIATPHSGVNPAYNAWEGGSDEGFDLVTRLAIEIILMTRKNDYPTPKDTIRELYPVVHDLLPTYNFLLTEDDMVIHNNTLTHQNTWLSNLDSNFSDYYNLFHAVYGDSKNTQEWYKVKPASDNEKKLGLWQDGKPYEILTSTFGDGTVLAKSATKSADPALGIDDADHREIMSDYETIKLILDKLNLDIPILPNKPSLYTYPYIFVTMQSPATFTVSGPTGSYQSNDAGIVIIPYNYNANFNITVNGTSSGVYTLTIGVVTENDSTSSQITGTTDQGQTDQYTISYNPSNLSADLIVDPTGNVILDSAYQQITSLKEKYPDWGMNLSLHWLDKIKNSQGKEKFKQIRNYYIQTLRNLSQFRKKHDLSDAFIPTLYISEDLIKSYYNLLSNKPNEVNYQWIQEMLEDAQKAYDEASQKILDSDSEKKVKIFTFAEELFEEGKIDAQKGFYLEADLKLYLCQLLFQEVSR